MAESHRDSGTDPPLLVVPLLREIKEEPMDYDDDDQADSDATMVAGVIEPDNEPKKRKKVVIKEEIKDEEDEPNSGGTTENANEQIYCYCQKRGCTEFMIACEHCDVWFHDTCVMIDVQMSAHIVHYYCDSCVAKHGVKVVYKNTFENFMRKRKNAMKAAETRKQKKELEMALRNSLQELKVDVKEPEKEVDEKEYEYRSPLCEDCINCVQKKTCGKCYYCLHNVGRCIKIFCFTELEKTRLAEKLKLADKTPPPPLASPKLSPKGSAKRKTQRKRKSGDSDDDELFFSESTSTRKMIKKELSYKEEQQLVDVEVGEKKKRGRKKGWRKSVDGKEAHEGDEGKEPKRKKKKGLKKEIKRVGKGAQPEKENGPENVPFDRPGYDTSLEERLDMSSSAYAHWQEEQGQLTENKQGKCSNPDCEKERRAQDNYCSEECGMKTAQAKLQRAGLVKRPDPLKAKRKYTRKPKKTEAQIAEEKQLEAISAWQEADYQRRKAEAEKERAKDNFVVPEGADLIQATLLRMQADAEKAKEEEREAAKKKKELLEKEALEKQRLEAEENYRKLTSYTPVGSQAVLNNAVNMLMAQSIVRPIPVHPLQGLFSLYNNLTPFGSPNPFVLPPSYPVPLFPNLMTAMRDHNDYLLDPILPFSQQNSPPATNSTPSTLSTASPAAFSVSPAAPAAAASFAAPVVPAGAKTPAMAVAPVTPAASSTVSSADIALLMELANPTVFNPLLAAAMNGNRQQ